jgi:WD40 repeat protein
VRRAAFSPDGRRLVSVGEDRQVIVWDFARRERLATFNDHSDWITAVAFSPDGRWFATASYDRTVIVWDAVGLRKAAVLRDHTAKVVAVAFSPDSQVLVTVDGADLEKDRATFLWHVGSWQPFARIPLGGIDTLAPLFTEGGRRLVYHITTSPSPLSNTWDVKTGRPLGDQFDHAWDCQNAALSPDGARLVGVTGSGEVIFADFKRRRFLSCDPVHQDNGRAAAFSPDGRLVATCAENVILWDAVTRRKITTIDYPSIVWSVTFSPDGRWLVTTHGDGAIRVWDVVERQRAVGFNEHEGAVRAVAWAPDGKRFASAGEDRVVMVWNAETGGREMLLAGHTTRVSGLAFAPDDKTLASVDLDGTVIIWDLDRQGERRRFGHPNGASVAYCLALSPDGRLVATSHGVYEMATGRQVLNFPLASAFNPSSIYGVAFSADGTRLAVAHAHGLQSVLDTTTWQIVEQTNLGPRQFISVSFAPSGKQMVTGEDGGSVQLWAAAPLRLINVIGQHAARIKAVAFSPDGRQVVSAGDDKLIALWDAGSGKLVTRIGLHTAPVYAVAFSPDGRRLISGGHDRSVRLYTRHRTLWGFRLD